MAASVTIHRDEITIQLSGWNALPSLRRIFHIPLAAIRSVRTERFSEDERDGARTGVGGPLTGIRTGSLVRDGRRYLLAYRLGGPTVTLELDREGFPWVGYDVVVLGVEPEAVELARGSAPAA
jgi:hypothetical protein